MRHRDVLVFNTEIKVHCPIIIFIQKFPILAEPFKHIEAEVAFLAPFIRHSATSSDWPATPIGDGL